MLKTNKDGRVEKQVFTVMFSSVLVVILALSKCGVYKEGNLKEENHKPIRWEERRY